PDKPFSNGDVEVRFRINGSLYLYTFPSTIFWKKGTIYHYAFSFNGQALKLLNSQTAPWIPGK
ncbi:MAG: fimbrillin family protein, partial [Tannerellaceae bacterium]